MRQPPSRCVSPSPRGSDYNSSSNPGQEISPSLQTERSQPEKKKHEELWTTNGMYNPIEITVNIFRLRGDLKWGFHPARSRMVLPSRFADQNLYSETKQNINETEFNAHCLITSGTCTLQK